MAYLDSGGAGKGAGDSGGGIFGGNNLSGLLGPVGMMIPGLVSAFGGNQPLPFQNNLTTIAGQIGQIGATASGEQQNLYGTGSALINPLLTGQLPAGAQSVVDQIVQKQTADTKAKYASLGQTGSTMEQSALNDINTNKGALTFQIAQQMASTGLQATQQSLSALNIELSANNANASIYSNLMNAQMKSDSNMMASIGSFASAFGKALPMMAAA